MLKPGGALRIVVPDAGRYLRTYAGADWEAVGILRGLGPERLDSALGCRYRTRMEQINNVFRQRHEHRYAYDDETLVYVKERYGFHSVEVRAFGMSRMPEVCIDQPARASENLYGEGIRPF